MQHPKPQFDKNFLAATEHHKLGRLEQAEPLYRMAIRNQPRNGDALRLLGGLLLQKGDDGAAEPILRRALALQPQNGEIITNLALTLNRLAATCYKEHQDENAIALFREALRLSPQDVNTAGGLALALQRTGALDEAEGLFRQVLNRQPGNIATLVNLATVLRITGRLQEATECLLEAKRVSPNVPEIHINLSSLYFADGQGELAHAEAAAALRLAPNNVLGLVAVGNALRSLNRLDEAEASYRSALDLDPSSAEARIYLGVLLANEKGQPDAAIALYDEVLRHSPENPSAKLNRGRALWLTGKSAEAADTYRAIAASAPQYAEALTELGALAYEGQQVDDALVLFDKALAVRPGWYGASFGKAVALLAKGEYGEGFRLYESGLNRRELRGRSIARSKPWDGSRVKSLMIWSEQGLGDTIHFIRYAELCRTRAERVIALVPPELARLVSTSKYIDEVPTSMAGDEFDAQASLMSLPAIFGTTPETVPENIPYLSVPAGLSEQMRVKLPVEAGLKIGLVWAGGAHESNIARHLADQRRSLHLSVFRELLEIPGTQFFTLQKGDAARQIQESGLEAKLTDVMAEVTDFLDTAALIEQLDLVISVDTAVAHLAGALGKPVWILSRFDADWRWLQNRPTSPWYPTARIFGQPIAGDWQSVIEQVKSALQLLAANKP